MTSTNISFFQPYRQIQEPHSPLNVALTFYRLSTNNILYPNDILFFSIQYLFFLRKIRYFAK